jgi:hypothetical protein
MTEFLTSGSKKRFPNLPRKQHLLRSVNIGTMQVFQNVRLFPNGPLEYRLLAPPWKSTVPHTGITATSRFHSPAMLELRRLPQGILSVVLRCWIGSRDLAKLDSALCVRTERQQFLDIITSGSFVLQTTSLATARMEKVNQFLEWMTRREIKTKEWTLAVHLEPHLFFEFAQRTGGQHVRSLTLSNMKEETAGIFISVFSVCKNISKVYIKGSEHWTGLSVLRGAAEQALEELSVINCGTGSIQQFKHNEFPHLRKLCLAGGYPAATVKGLLRAAPNLTDLRIQGTLVDDEGFQVLSAHARSLTSLVLNECSCISSASMAALAPACAALKVLGVGGSSSQHGNVTHSFGSYGTTAPRRLTATAVEAFAAHCKLLECLQLRDMTADGLAVVLGRCGARLQFLSLINVQFSKPAELFSVAAHCSHLQQLCLDNCVGITADSLIRLMGSLPSVTLLVVQSCTAVTDAVLRAISKNMPKLKGLNLLHSSGYTEDGALTIIRSLRALEWFVVETKHAIFTRLAVGVWKELLPSLRVTGSGWTTTKSSLFAW